MPMPEPRKNEEHDDFIDRCMGDDEMVKDFDDPSQRRAVCESQWERKPEEDAMGRLVSDTQIREFLADRERQREHVLRNRRGGDDPSERFRVVHNAAESKAEILLYDEIGFFGVSSRDFAEALRGIKAKEITLHVNSPGGDVFDGLAMMNGLRQHPATVTAVIDGLAASAASLVVLGADQIVMAKGSMLMIHEPAGMSFGPPDTHRKTADVLDTIAEDMAGLYKTRGDSRINWRQKMKDETWMGAEQAVRMGLADEVDDTTPAVQNTFDLSIYAHVPPELMGRAEGAAGMGDQPFPSITIHNNGTLNLTPSPDQASRIAAIMPGPDPEPEPPMPEPPSPEPEPAATSEEPEGANDQEPVFTLDDAKLMTEVAAELART